MAIQDFTAGQVLTAAQMDSLQANDYNQTVSTKTANYTLVAADKGTRVVMNAAGATTITVNTSLFNAGDTLYLQNIGAGVCTVTAGTATVSSAGPLALPQYGSGTLYFTSAGVAIYFPSAVTAATVSSGLVFIAKTTFTTAASLAMTNVFSSTYDNYLVLITNLIGSANTGAQIKLGSGGTADSGATYNFGNVGENNNTDFGTQTLNATYWEMSAGFVGGAGSGSQMTLTLSSPNLARPTTVNSINFGNRADLPTTNVEVFGGVKNTSTQYTDFFITQSGGPTLACTCAIYGYANS